MPLPTRSRFWLAITALAILDKARDIEEVAEALKPCPFCGYEGIVQNTATGRFIARCGNLNCPIFPMTASVNRRGYAVEIWNRREGRH